MNAGIAVVTGGSEGIGLAIVTALAAQHYRVVTGAPSSSAALDRLVAAGTTTFVQSDLTQRGAAESLLAATGDHVDLVVNNVGTSIPRPGGFLSVTDDDWARSLELNLMTAVRVVRAALPRMTAGGAMVTVTSDNARLPDPHLVDYGAAKAALASLTKALAAELVSRGIRVNAVSPGPVDTRRWATDEARSNAASRVPTGRLTTPDEVAHVVKALASPHSGNTTGATWTVDGGLVPVI